MIKSSAAACLLLLASGARAQLAAARAAAETGVVPVAAALGAAAAPAPIPAWLLAPTFAAAAPSGGAAAPAPALQRAKALDLRPTQMSVGMREVAEKADHLRGMTADEADEWLKARPVPVVLAPDGRTYLIDHHHLVRAAWEAGIEHVRTEVAADLSSLSEDDFWAKMKAENWVYPYDQFGKGPHDVKDLPKDVRGLADDPYRSVAGAVRDQGGYEKTEAPFSEFLWAQFFRESLKTHPVHHDFDAAVAEAMTLARTDAAKALPGWSGGR